ncbi:MAG: hypothetical protein FD161_3163 [Limisphaerales bacterium]|nr:MAG: hypothetical protein FD161_3163 [Limisphaerales bacterium]TXT49149.1 MAG: hypothetical protein FD140_3258 [Limisphaerales bacterium]
MGAQQATQKHLEAIALEGGASIADSILARVRDFPKREGFLNSWMKHELESVPSQILWRGLEDEAAPVFVVYKLLHEAFSNSPQFFRRFITSLMSAQPERFSTVFSRETLWSAVARAPGLDVSEAWASAACIRCHLEALNSKSFWRRSDEELAREAVVISAALTQDPKRSFRDGVAALRRLQMEKATGLTQGNLMLFVPAKLNQFASEVVELGMSGHLPSLKELCGKIHEAVRDPLGEGRHESVPVDVLFNEMASDSIECFLLVRENANAADQRELRRKSLLVRYFLKYAFSAYGMANLKVSLAFYLDRGATFKSLAKSAKLFHDEELVGFDEFWKRVTGTPEGVQLVLRARDAASEKLTSSSFMKSIKEHFGRERKGKPPTRSSLFPNL